MGNVNHYCNGEYRNDGWSLAGSGVTQLQHCWGQSSVDDTKYASCPSSKGAGCVTFPIDISSVPDGAVITSITIRCRCNRTTSNPDSITIQLTCSDDTSRWTTRTVTPTQVIEDIEIATYQCDATGRPWDRHRLNKIMCRAFCYGGHADRIRCYRLYCVINYRVRPTVDVSAPSGTVYTSSPTISWVYNQTDGDPQKKAEYRIFTAVQAAAASFDPDTAPPVFATTINGDLSSAVLPTSINPDDYKIYVRVWSTFDAKSLWVGKSFTVQGPAPAVPGNDDGDTGGTPGVGTILVVPDSYNSSASLTFRDASNLLSVQQADFETQTDSTESTQTNCTAARDASKAFGSGLASLKLTASSAATMSDTTSYVEVAEQTPITVRGQFLAGSTGRDINLVAEFFDSTFTSLGSITASGSDVTGSWTEISESGTTPIGTQFATVKKEIVSPASLEVHYVDRIGLMYGADSAWSDGGHMSRNLLSAAQSNMDAADGSNPWITANSATTYSRVAASGTGSNGSNMSQMKYVGISPTIAYRATSSVFTSPTSGTNYTLNKPSGTTDGDLLIAYVTCTGANTIHPPADWTLVNSAIVSTSTGESLFVLKHNGAAADPSTWTDGFLTTATTRRSAVVVGYSGAADIDSQFVAESVKTDSSGNLVHTTATVNNTVGNAWRLCAFAYRDNVSGGASVANIAPPSVVPPIAFVGAATKWTSITSSTSSYTLNRPSGVVSGDLMIATVAISNTTPTVTAPSGWTVVTQFTSDGSVDGRMAILKRTAGSSEPSSWTGSLSVASLPILTEVVAYRNCDTAANQFIDYDTSVKSGGSTITTGSVTNDNSGAWRICSFMASRQTLTSSPSFSSSEVSERADDSAAYSGSGYHETGARAINAGIYDSNGSVSTGVHSRTGTLSASWYDAASWIALIKPLPSAPAPGANETERVDNTNGSANPWQTLSVYDSNGVIGVGNTSVTGVLTPGSGTAADSVVSWIGIMKPADPVVEGTVEAKLTSAISLSTIDQSVIDLSGGKVSLVGSFLGSTDGTPYLTMEFYNGNELISSQVAEGSVFNSTTWTKSAATFTVPTDVQITRLRPIVGAKDRAINDTVSFDSVGIMLGETSTYRPGTGRDAHPIWSKAQIQYQEDDGTGYGDWIDLPGQGFNPPVYDDLSGSCVYVDQTIIPLVKRRYRIQTVSYGFAGDVFVSGYGPPSEEVGLSAANWWIKDIGYPENNMILRVRPEMDVTTTNTATVFQPLGEDFPYVVTEGFKGDTFTLTFVVNKNEYADLRALLNNGRTLYLQTDVDNAWWVRAISDLDADLLPTGRRKVNPLRFFKVTFAQVKPEV